MDGEDKHDQKYAGQLTAGCLQALGKNEGFKSAAAALQSPLLKITKDGLQKEPMRVDGLLALHSLAILARGNQDLEEKLRAEPAWQGLFSTNNSALLSIDVAAKQNDQDACLIVKLCQHLLLHVSPSFTL